MKLVLLICLYLCRAVVPSMMRGQSLPSRPQIQLSPIQVQDNTIQSRFNYFDLELLRTFGNEGNYLISPASIKTTLGMILEGSKGRSAEEISDLLRIPIDQNGVRDKLQTILYDLTDKSGSTILNMANGLFVSNTVNVMPMFQNTLFDIYNAMVKSLNFSKPQESADVVNKWVSENTQQQITQLIDSSAVDPSISAIIANALYFKGTWKEAFNSKATYDHKCFRVNGMCYETPMMHVVGNFKYKFIDELDSSAVELPYKDGKYAMLILLPNEKSTVDGLIRDLQHVSFSHLVNALDNSEVLVEIPKFDIEFTADLVPSLSFLGIKTVFGSNADLSGISDRGNVKIDSIIHKTKIAVDEEGSVAAAATGAVVVPLMGLTIPEVLADRPFLFFIYHVASKNIIFEGRFNQPNYQNSKPQQPDTMTEGENLPPKEIQSAYPQNILKKDDTQRGGRIAYRY